MFNPSVRVDIKSRIMQMFSFGIQLRVNFINFGFILLFITAQVSSQMLRVWLCQCEV